MNDWPTIGQTCLRARERRLAAGIEKVPGIQSRISKQRIQLSVIFISTILRHRINLGTEIATKLCIPKQSRNRNLFDRLNRLGNESDESLPPHANIGIVIVRAVH